MPITVVKAQFLNDDGTGYLTDIGTSINTSANFRLPPDVPDTEITTILQNIGANIPSAIKPNPPCSERVGSTLRKLEFIRANSNTMSVPVSSRTDLVSAATVIKGILNSNGSEVVCIKLLGEYFPDLADELGMNYAGTFATSHVPTSGGKQFIYSGNVEYQSDASTGTVSTVIQPIKSITNNENAPSTQLSAAWTGCVGDLTQVLPCRGKGRRNPRKHRRFELTFLTKVDPTDLVEDAQTETAELPVVSASATDILSCGQTAASLAGAYCIGYRGESYRLFNNLLP
ncbi:MAG: hypothetical protein AAFY16_02080 [Cyanobacteria bacterium J06642_3]